MLQGDWRRHCGAANMTTTINEEEKRSKNWLLGFFFIFMVAVVWAAASVVVQDIYDDVKAPFFLTYVANSLFIVYLPFWYGARFWGLVKHHPRSRIPSEESLFGQHPYDNLDSQTNEGTLLSVRETMKISLIICPIWFLANFSYNLSLSMTSVTSSTIISVSSSLFTFLFSLVMLSEVFTYFKLGGVLFCMVGSVLVALADKGDNGTSTALGDVVCLAGALMYGLYTTLIRKYIPDDETVSMSLFFGYLGLFNAVLLLPVLLTVEFTLEDLGGLSWRVLGMIIAKGLFDNVLSDYLWARAVVLTSPTVATLGLSLTIPLGMTSDAVLGKGTPSALSGCGAALVVFGFVLVNLPGDATDRLLCCFGHSPSSITSRESDDENLADHDDEEAKSFVEEEQDDEHGVAMR